FPRAEAQRHGDRTDYAVGAKTVASVTPGEGGRGWTTFTHSRERGAEPIATYRTRDKAEANAEKLVRRGQKYETSHHYYAGTDVTLAADLKAHVSGGGN